MDDPDGRLHWTATEAITWLAWRKPESWGEHILHTMDFVNRWVELPLADAALTLLEEAAANVPLPGHYSKVAEVHPIIERIRDKHRNASDYVPSDTALTEMMRDELKVIRDRDEDWQKAANVLLRGIFEGGVTGWGIRPEDDEPIPRKMPSEVGRMAVQFRRDAVEPDESCGLDEHMEVRRLRYKGIRFQVSEVKALLKPPVDAPSVESLVVKSNSAETPRSGVFSSGRRPSKKPSGLDYRELDKPLVAEMRRLIETGGAKGAYDAALIVAHLAKGTGKVGSKVTRLMGRYSDAFRAEHD